MADNRNQGHTAWVAGAGLGVLTLNSALSIYRAWGDHASTLFVSASYTTLLLLFRCLRAYERAPPGSPARESARRAVWPLTTLLTLSFAWKVAAVMPSAVAASPARERARRALWALTTLVLGVVNSEMALADHRDRGGLGSATLVLAAYGTLLAAVGVLFRELARGVTGRGVGSADAAR